MLIFLGSCKTNNNDNPTGNTTDGSPTSINAPSNFFAKAISLNEIELTWDPSSGSNNYNIYKNDTKIATTNKLTYTDNFTLTEQQQYDYYVTAIDGKGNESAHSNISTTAFISDTLNNQTAKISYNVSILHDGNLYFLVTVDPTLNLSIFGGMYAAIRIYSNAGTDMYHFVGPSGGNQTSISTGPYPIKAGNYVFELNSAGGSGNFTLTPYYTQSIFNNDNEPNDGTENAIAIDINTYYEGHLGYLGGAYGTLDIVDFYKFSLNKKTDLKYNIIVDPTLNLNPIRIYSNDGTTILNSFSGPSGGNQTSVTGGPITLEAGNYYVAVNRANGFGGYKIKFFE